MELFAESGVHVLADGQYGSCGKGALAGWLARQAIKREMGFHTVVSNAGPNSGHTFYSDGQKHVLKQLPSFGVQSHLLGYSYPIYLTAGSIIDPLILGQEIGRYPGITVFVHPNAGIVEDETRDQELCNETIMAVSGTRSGSGAAIINKVSRKPGAIMRNSDWFGEFKTYREDEIDPRNNRIFMEISQGFSLGLNSIHYPKVTSRECTFAQGFADARIAPRHYRRGYLAFRTFPIRVGNTPEGDSGGWYDDQKETSWEELGQTPELTTVTGRVRRVASWSWTQFRDAMDANSPTHVFLNFMNYLNHTEKSNFIREHLKVRRNQRHERYELILGKGAKPEDINEYLDPSRL